MDIQLHVVLLNVRCLLKSYDKLSRAVPNPQEAQHNADKALDKLLASLTEPTIVATVESLIIDARAHILADPQAFHDELTMRRKDLTHVEIRVCHDSGTRRRDIDAIYSRIARKQLDGEVSKYVSNVANLRAQLVEVHLAVKQQVLASREQPRLKKKRRKRDLTLGITSAIVGTAVIVADIPLPLVFAFSYALGANALHQAIRDIVGTKR